MFILRKLQKKIEFSREQVLMGLKIVFKVENLGVLGILFVISE